MEIKEGRAMAPRMHNEIKAGEILQKSVSWLQKDRRTRRLVPYVKISRSVRYLEEDLINFIKDNRVSSSREEGGVR